ncbi:hypothetical protein COO60DRAFT_1479350 [Scenedesmus sp. NREL 46B-D3]|nr:hypothetical protein COO60DRAFT_1479350 [Scenedesmus sp. NREL 46B-D3]
MLKETQPAARQVLTGHPEDTRTTQASPAGQRAAVNWAAACVHSAAHTAAPLHPAGAHHRVHAAKRHPTCVPRAQPTSLEVEDANVTHEAAQQEAHKLAATTHHSCTPIEAWQPGVPYSTVPGADAAAADDPRHSPCCACTAPLHVTAWPRCASTVSGMPWCSTADLRTARQPTLHQTLRTAHATRRSRSNQWRHARHKVVRAVHAHTQRWATELHAMENSYTHSYFDDGTQSANSHSNLQSQQTHPTNIA